MSTIYSEIDKIRLNRLKNKLEKENNTNLERTTQINLILNKLNKKTDENNLENMFKEIDKYNYMKTWNKLNDFHKIEKIKEFVNENYKNNVDLENLLIDAINEKKLNTQKHVNYDPLKSKIISINALTEDQDGKFQLKNIKIL